MLMKRRRAGLLFAILPLFVLLLFTRGANAMESTCPSGVAASAALARGTAELPV